MKLELVLLGPCCAGDEVFRAGDPELGEAPPIEEARVDGRLVFSGAHPFVEVEMMDARSLSSKRRAVEGEDVGENTLSTAWP